MIITPDTYGDLMPVRVVADGGDVDKCFFVDLSCGQIRSYKLNSKGNFIFDGVDGVEFDDFYAESMQAYDKDGNLIGEYDGKS